MPANRLPYFPFHVDDYLSDPAVMAMDADAEGCYIRLILRSWRSPTPGRISETLIPEIAGIHRLAEQYRMLWGDDVHVGDVEVGMMATPERIGHGRSESVMGQMAGAFDTESEPGVWIQKRMVDEWRIANRRTAQRQHGAAVTNEKRWSKVAMPSPSGRSAVANVEVEVELKRSEKSFDSVLESGSVNGQVNPVRTRTVNPTPKAEPHPIAKGSKAGAALVTKSPADETYFGSR